MLYKVVSTFWDDQKDEYVLPGQDYELDTVRGNRLIVAGCVLEIEQKKEPKKGKKASDEHLNSIDASSE